MGLLTSTLHESSLALGVPAILQPTELTSNAIWPTANKAIFSPLAPLSIAVNITAIEVLVFAAAGNLDVGLVTVSGTTATRLGSSGSTAAAGVVAIQRLALTSTVTLAPGRSDYYVVVAASDATTLSVGMTADYDWGSLFLASMGYLMKTASLPIAASTTTLVALTDAMTPWVRLVRG
jgi:hypothetical protein